MTEEEKRALVEAADVSAVSQLVIRERESRDLCMWKRMKACFHPDSEVCISWFQGRGHDFVDASREMFERGTRAKHRLGPVLVTLNGERAVATLSAIIDIPTLVNSIELTLSAHCLLLYRAEKREGRWGIIGFDVIYRRDEFIPAILGQSIEIPAGKLSQFRPSYRNLCYSLELNGFQPSNDLPGEDRPETVTRIMKKVFHWAGLEVPD